LTFLSVARPDPFSTTRGRKHQSQLLGVSDEVEAVLKQRSQHGEHGLRPAFEIRRHVGVSAGEHVEAIGAPNLARR
jgi:hypothetical protein